MLLPFFQPLYTYEVEAMLQKVFRISPGCYYIPYWVSNSSLEVADVFARIYYCTLRFGVLPRHWLSAVDTPVPKTSIHSTLSDFRPISVVSLSRRREVGRDRLAVTSSFVGFNC